MKISPDGLTFLKLAEGLRLIAYQCSAGVWTIGYGHTKDVKQGDTCSQQQAEEWLLEDLEEVYDCLARKVTVPLNQPQFDSLCSFVFNLGCGNFSASTLRRKLNEGDYEGCVSEFGRWANAGGQVVDGLRKRRAGEAMMFASADPETTVPGAA